MSELKLNDPAAVKDEDVMKNIMSEKFRLYVDQNILRGVEMAVSEPAGNNVDVKA